VRSTQKFSYSVFAASTLLRRLWTRSCRAFVILALSLAAIVSCASIVQAHGAKYSSLASSPATCSAQCAVSRGTIWCPHFLTTTEHYPCAGYKMQSTACGEQLKRVFMCR
jgi:hypothetical protein